MANNKSNSKYLLNTYYAKGTLLNDEKHIYIYIWESVIQGDSIYESYLLLKKHAHKIIIN